MKKFEKKTITIALSILVMIMFFKLNEWIITPNDFSAIKVINSVDFNKLLVSFLFVFFFSAFFGAFTEEALKLFKINNSIIIKISTIIMIIVFFYLTTYSWLNILTTEQFELLSTIFGFPFVVFIPSIIRFLMSFNNKKG